MPRPTKSALEALLDLLDQTSQAEAKRALETILARQAERTDREPRAA